MVPHPVDERVPEARVGDHLAAGRVDLRERDARAHRGDRRKLRAQHDLVELALARREPPVHRKRARHVRRVAAVLGAAVEHHQLSVHERAVVAVVVEHRGVEPAAGDGAERQFARAVGAVGVLDDLLQVELVHPGADARHRRGEAPRGHPSRLADALDLRGALRRAHAFDDLRPVLHLRSRHALGLRAEDRQVLRHRLVPLRERHDAGERPRPPRRLEQRPPEHARPQHRVEPGPLLQRGADLRAEAVPLLLLGVQRAQEEDRAPRRDRARRVQEQHRARFAGHAGQVLEVRVRPPRVVQRRVRLARGHDRHRAAELLQEPLAAFAELCGRYGRRGCGAHSREGTAPHVRSRSVTSSA